MDQLRWTQAERETAFVATTPRKTYRVKWLPDAHLWVYDGRPFEHVDMAKGAAEAEHMLKNIYTEKETPDVTD